MYLAFGSSDRLARLYSVEPTQAREVLVISGHQGPVTHVHFHPSEKVLVRLSWYIYSLGYRAHRRTHAFLVCVYLALLPHLIWIVFLLT